METLKKKDIKLLEQILDHEEESHYSYYKNQLKFGIKSLILQIVKQEKQKIIKKIREKVKKLNCLNCNVRVKHTNKIISFDKAIDLIEKEI